MSFLKRMLSADYRRAISAEAAGDYAEAARAYALAGERTKVAEMHLLRSEAAGTSSDARLMDLHAAIGWANEKTDAAKAVRRRIARALFNWARRSPVLTQEDRKVVGEAAELFIEVGDFGGAGECFEFVGDDLQAAEAYQKAGEVERLEAVLQRDEAHRKRTYKVTDAFEEYRLQLGRGERDLAMISIRTCVELAAEHERAPYHQALQELENRLLCEGTVLLRSAQSTLYVGRFPAVIGREITSQVVLRDAGISRLHAHLERTENSGYSVLDLGSKNGTFLGGVRMLTGAKLPLPPSGELGVGENCSFRFECSENSLILRVTSGLDRGLTIICGTGAMDVAGGLGELSFASGRPKIRARGGSYVILNGVQCGNLVQLCRQDVLELGDHRFEVA